MTNQITPAIAASSTARQPHSLRLGQILPTDKERESDDQRPDNEGVAEQREACRKAVHKVLIVRPASPPP